MLYNSLIIINKNAKFCGGIALFTSGKGKKDSEPSIKISYYKLENLFQEVNLIQ